MFLVAHAKSFIRETLVYNVPSHLWMGMGDNTMIDNVYDNNNNNNHNNGGGGGGDKEPNDDHNTRRGYVCAAVCGEVIGLSAAGALGIMDDHHKS